MRLVISLTWITDEADAVRLVGVVSSMMLRCWQSGGEGGGEEGQEGEGEAHVGEGVGGWVWVGCGVGWLLVVV